MLAWMLVSNSQSSHRASECSNSVGGIYVMSTCLSMRSNSRKPNDHSYPCVAVYGNASAALTVQQRAHYCSCQRALSAKNRARETPHGCSQETQYCDTHTHMNARTSEHTPLGGNTFWLPWVSAFYLNHSSLSQQVGLSFKAPTMIPGAWNVASDCARRCSLHTQTHTHRHARNGAQMAHPL